MEFHKTDKITDFKYFPPVSYILDNTLHAAYYLIYSKVTQLRDTIDTQRIATIKIATLERLLTLCVGARRYNL